MAVPNSPWVKNVKGGDPVYYEGLFQAGATQAVAWGQLLELSGSNFIPLETDDASLTAEVAIYAGDAPIEAGDLAGYYTILLPTSFDVFDFEIATAAASAIGLAINSTTNARQFKTGGSNVMGDVYWHEGLPRKQGHLSRGQIVDQGTTIRVSNRHQITIKASVSYAAALQQ